MNENATTSNSIQKYIEIKDCSQENMDRYRIEVANTDLYNKLNQDLNTDPNYNYDIFSSELQVLRICTFPEKLENLTGANTRKKHG